MPNTSVTAVNVNPQITEADKKDLRQQYPFLFNVNATNNQKRTGNKPRIINILSYERSYKPRDDTLNVLRIASTTAQE